MITKNISETVTLPNGIQAQYGVGLLTMKGPKGEISRLLRNPKIQISVTGAVITLFMPVYTKHEKKNSNTFIAHIKNMIKGVTEGHEYKLKICSGHFPMNVSIKNTTLEVKNFIGEAVPRRFQFTSQVSVTMDGTEIVVRGIDKEITAQTAASIEKLTRRTGFDRRIFQDGIYIVEKDGKKIA